MAAGEKICFVIAPIGGEGTETRKRSDQILKYVIQPSVSSCGYEALRADQISQPGDITTQVIHHRPRGSEGRNFGQVGLTLASVSRPA
jgi:hypothetical protein